MPRARCLRHGGTELRALARVRRSGTLLFFQDRGPRHTLKRDRQRASRRVTCATQLPRDFSGGPCADPSGDPDRGTRGYALPSALSLTWPAPTDGLLCICHASPPHRRHSMLHRVHRLHILSKERPAGCGMCATYTNQSTLTTLAQSNDLLIARATFKFVMAVSCTKNSSSSGRMAWAYMS